MPFPLVNWRSSRLRRRRDPFARAKHGDLDIVAPPPFDTSRAHKEEALAKVAEHIRQLQPGGLDGGSRHVLDEMIDAWMDQEIARATSHHLERDVVSSMLIGLAREQVARYQPGYAADYARAQRARQVLAEAYRALTGKELTDLPPAYPDLSGAGPARSALGAVDLSCAIPHFAPADLTAPLGGPLNGSALNGHQSSTATPSGDGLPEGE